MSTQGMADRVFDVVDLLEDRILKLEESIGKLSDRITANNLQVYSLRNRLRPPKIKPYKSKAIQPPALNTGDLHKIIACVCREFGFAPDSVCGKSRWKSLVIPRHVVMYLAREKGVSLGSVGTLLSFHHTSILYGQRHITKLLETDSQLAERIERLKDQLSR